MWPGLEGQLATINHFTINCEFWICHERICDIKKSKKKTDAKYSKLYKKIWKNSWKQKIGNIKGKREVIKNGISIYRHHNMVGSGERIRHFTVEGSLHKQTIKI